MLVLYTLYFFIPENGFILIYGQLGFSDGSLNDPCFDEISLQFIVKLIGQMLCAVDIQSIEKLLASHIRSLLIRLKLLR